MGIACPRTRYLPDRIKKDATHQITDSSLVSYRNDLAGGGGGGGVGFDMLHQCSLATNF